MNLNHPLPSDEEARLQTLGLYLALGLQPERELDRLTALAARLFRVPMAFISLVGRDRQYLKSHHGVDLCETNRSVSFCSHAIARHRETKVFVVPDAAQDPRFADNPMVAGEPHVRFYAGAPCVTTDGYALGTLCLVDTVPRTLSPAEQENLSDLAASAMDALELQLVAVRHRAAAAAKELAENASDAKSTFLSRMSHELRTPLNAILGFGQLLELGNLGEQESESVDHILQAGRHLLHLINEVLAISRIEAGHLDLSLEPISVAEITEECLSLTGQLAEQQGIRCESHWSEGGLASGQYVLADRQRLRQVLLNLLSNAIKYNRRGGQVLLACRESQGGGKNPRLRLEVRDTGEGLTAGQIGRLFQPFERLDADRTGQEGTGLGLALSKGLVEAMNGRIGVDSTPGEGCTFWIDLPVTAKPFVAMEETPVFATPPPDEECTGTLLYIEDNLSNLRLIELLVASRPGLRLLSAQEGSLGLEIARSSDPDLILLDLHLPDLTGWEVLAELQANEATRSIPTIIISADATQHQIERFRQAGACDYLTKPIDVPTLLAVMKEHLDGCLPLAATATAGAGRA